MRFAFSVGGCHEDALTSYNKALEVQPDDYWAWCQRASVLRHLERYEEAIAQALLQADRQLQSSYPRATK
jgi:tetratricopeptide (TPR) repeat protein